MAQIKIDNQAEIKERDFELAAFLESGEEGYYSFDTIQNCKDKISELKETYPDLSQVIVRNHGRIIIDEKY